MAGLQIVLMQVWTGISCQNLKGPKCSTAGPCASTAHTHTRIKIFRLFRNIMFNGVRQSGVIFRYQITILKISCLATESVLAESQKRKKKCIHSSDNNLQKDANSSNRWRWLVTFKHDSEMTHSIAHQATPSVSRGYLLYMGRARHDNHSEQ